MDLELLKGPIVRLIISLLMGFPFSIFYRIHFIKNKKGNELQRNIYTFITGFIISLYFNGKDFYHPLISVFVTFIIIQHIKNPKYITIASWVFNFGYLLISYYLYSSTEYDLNWLTPQSVICLRLIGISMDYSDGQKKDDKAVKKSRTVYTGLTPPTEWPIKEKPLLIEMLGYCYFYGSSIVGPQFSFRRYKKFISFELFNTKDISMEKDLEKLLESSRKHSILHFLKGLIYTAIFFLISSRYYSSFILTKEFTEFNIIKKFIYVWITGRFVLFKYFGVWVLVETQGIINMIQLDGINSEKNDYYWNAINNVDTTKFAFVFGLDELVCSYNIKTNLWGKHYVYKRFAFLGNKLISLFINLTFLSIWHGFHIGYPFSFYFEFVLFILQDILKYWFKPLNQHMANNLETNKSTSFKILYIIYHAICTILTVASVAYPLIGFDLLTWNKIKIAYHNMGWIGHIIAVIMFCGHNIALKIKSLRKTNNKKEE
ncbi:MBOAT-domain-containing protein, partial [Anaeromyces robustus]